jgi:hypothetical protein
MEKTTTKNPGALARHWKSRARSVGFLVCAVWAGACGTGHDGYPNSASEAADIDGRDTDSAGPSGYLPASEVGSPVLPPSRGWPTPVEPPDPRTTTPAMNNPGGVNGDRPARPESEEAVASTDPASVATQTAPEESFGAVFAEP